jgi:hypothetical protein
MRVGARRIGAVYPVRHAPQPPSWVVRSLKPTLPSPSRSHGQGHASHGPQLP